MASYKTKSTSLYERDWGVEREAPPPYSPIVLVDDTREFLTRDRTIGFRSAPQAGVAAVYGFVGLHNNGTARLRILFAAPRPAGARDIVGIPSLGDFRDANQATVAASAMRRPTGVATNAEILTGTSTGVSGGILINSQGDPYQYGENIFKGMILRPGEYLWLHCLQVNTSFTGEFMWEELLFPSTPFPDDMRGAR